MVETVSRAAERAIEATPASEGESCRPQRGRTIALGSEGVNHEWFYDAACKLLGKSPGLALHMLTGYPLSSCEAYVHHDQAKRRRPPEHFIRHICRAREGGPFLRAFMDGCQAPHWLDLERAERIAAQVDRLDLS